MDEALAHLRDLRLRFRSNPEALSIVVYRSSRGPPPQIKAGLHQLKAKVTRLREKL